MNELLPTIRSIGSGVVMLLLAMAIVTFGMLGWTDVRAEVELTKHNLGSTSATGNNQYDGTAAVCVFCHTPHGGSGGAVPLWNRDLTLHPDSSYQTYADLNTTTLDGAEAPVGSVSVACLSCHDGTQAMNNVLNDPGSGTVNGTFGGGNWTGANQTGGKITAGLITNLGTDLQNDHPIGIQYGGGGIDVNNLAGTLNDPDFAVQAPAGRLGTENLNGTQVWWVDTETTPNGTREKTDMLLYTRTFATVDQPFVECASCHDPHTSNATFLRASNDGSALCRACHSK